MSENEKEMTELIRISKVDGMNRLWVNTDVLDNVQAVTAELGAAMCQHIVQSLMYVEEIEKEDVMEYTKQVCAAIMEAVELVYNGQGKPVN